VRVAIGAPGDSAMAGKADVLLLGPKKALIVDGLSTACNLHMAADAKDFAAFIAELAARIRAIAISATTERADAALMSRLPRLELVSTFGVGYDHVDVKWAGEHGITVTNTPGVLDEEVADTALGLLLCTVRELPQAERYLRAGKWLEKGYRLTPASLRGATVGLVGMGRIGQAIARRLEAFQVKVVYHSRRPQSGVPYTHYPNLVAMARDVDVLLAIVPGGPTTLNMINAEVLDALGPEGILINMARGTVVDEQALIKALKERRILSAGLDVYVKEPEVPPELIALDNVVLLPHLGSASVATRRAMDQIVVDNVLAWSAGKPPLTPVPETPWPPKKQP
jgi:lactate dehydrogenase-like 2-hydroxyacid dehydrogenase